MFQANVNQKISGCEYMLLHAGMSISDILNQGAVLLLYELCGRNSAFHLIQSVPLQMRISLHFPFNNAQESHVSNGLHMRILQMIQVYMELIRRETTAEQKK